MIRSTVNDKKKIPKTDDMLNILAHISTSIVIKSLSRCKSSLLYLNDEVTDGRVVRAGVSVTWNVLS